MFSSWLHPGDWTQIRTADDRLGWKESQHSKQEGSLSVRWASFQDNASVIEIICPTAILRSAGNATYVGLPHELGNYLSKCA